MSVVSHETDEVVKFDRAAAERRAQQIEARLTAVGESFTTAMQKIREAIEQRDDIALGYRSPGDYIRDRFGRALSGLPVEMRREAVRELTEAGMSTRAIAPVVDVSQQQVARDRQVTLHVSPAPQAPEPTIPQGEPVSRDVGSGQAPEGEGSPGDSPVRDAAASAPDVRAAPRPPAPVTGIDGKTYNRPTPKAKPEPIKPRRRPLPDSFFTATVEARKKVESLHRLIADDRFPQNAEKVAAAHRNDLLRIRDLLAQVINALPTEESN